MPEAPYGWAVVVTTPPPSETFVVGRYKTRERAFAAAEKWGGGIEWTGPYSGVAHFGERVDIEPAQKPGGRLHPLLSPRWDEIFETGVFEQWFGPELGFPLNESGEVVAERRTEYEAAANEAFRWLMTALEFREIHPYHVMQGQIYPSDVLSITDELKARRPMRKGPKEWLPVTPERHWSAALRRALLRMLEELR